MYFKAHSMDFNWENIRYEEKNELKEKQQKIFHFINQEFLVHYPLFYEPKWKIYFSGSPPSLKILTLLNHLAYGYFY